MDQLGGIFDSMVNEMTIGMADNDLVRFVLQSKSLDYPISLPFMPRHELKGTSTVTKSLLQITLNNFKNKICLKF